MANLKLTLTGEDRASPAFRSAAGSARDLGKTTEESGEASAKAFAKAFFSLQTLIRGLELAAKAAVKFATDSVKAYSQSEVAQKRLLAATAGPLASALKEQSQSVERLATAWSGIQQEFGGFVALVDAKFGILKGLADMMNAAATGAAAMNAFIGGTMKSGSLAGGASAVLSALSKDLNAFDPVSVDSQAKQAKAAAEAAATAAKLREDEQRATEERVRRFLDAEQEITQRRAEEEQRRGEESGMAYQRQVEKQERQYAEMQEFERAHQEELNKLRAEARELESKEMFEAFSERRKMLQSEMEDQRRQMEEAGNAIAMSFANSIASVLSTISAGGEVDPGEVAGDFAASILGGLISVAGFALSGVTGGLSVPIATALSAGVSGSIRASTRRKPKVPVTPHSSLPPKRHDGGWMDRYHLGGLVPGMGADEIPAILQPGERVLSRNEVSRMGGPAGVDSAAAGGRRGGHVQVTINAMDARSVKELFQDEGGRGFREAIKSGRGPMAALFGKGIVS